MLTKQIIEEQLRQVIDPELHVNIVDLGLIYTIEVSEVNQKPFVKILMTLTTPGCPLAGTIQRMIKDSLYALKAIDVDQDVDVEVTFDPPWTIDMMSEEARAELGFD